MIQSREIKHFIESGNPLNVVDLSAQALGSCTTKRQNWN